MKRLIFIITMMTSCLYTQDDFDFDFDFDNTSYQQDDESGDEFDVDSYRMQFDKEDVPTDSSLPQKNKEKVGPVKWEDVQAQKPAQQLDHATLIQ